MIALMIIFLSVYLATSINNLQTLDKQKEKIEIAYKVNNQIRMILPAFYYGACTLNTTGYTINYHDPAVETWNSYYGVGNASSTILSAFTEEGGIEDPTIFDMLDGKVCNYVTSTYYTDCMSFSDSNSIGLLGLFSKYYTISATVTEYLNNPTKTADFLKGILAPYSVAVGNIHFVIYDVCDSLSRYLVKTFNETVEEETSRSLSLFLGIVGTVAISLLVFRIIVLTRLHNLNLALKKTVDLLPYKMIYENKVISYYLTKEMSTELGNLNMFN